MPGKVLRFFRILCRILIGTVFIASGFLKATDPIGTSLKVAEYMQAFGVASIVGLVGFTKFSLIAAISLSAFEFLIGAAVLNGFKTKFFSVSAVVMSAFFFVLTFISAVTGLVHDCGCFGEAYKLSPWNTFYKNVVLLACSLFIYLQRKRITPVANRFWENIYTGGYSLFILAISFYSLKNLPPVDFSDFRCGTDLMEMTTGAPELQYKTTLIYSKDGKKREFAIDSLPDDTWSFVDSRTTLVSGSEEDASRMRFDLKTADGEYVTEDILRKGGPAIFISFYYRGNITEGDLGRLKKLGDSLNYGTKRADFYLLSSMNEEQTTEFLKPVYDAVERENIANLFDSDGEYKGLPFRILYSDIKTVITFNRSNGGVTYVRDGEILKKWSSFKYSNKKVINAIEKSPGSVSAKSDIRSQMYVIVSILIIVSMCVILRFISRALYKTVKKGVDAFEEIVEG